MDLLSVLEVPVLAAPMAGGPSTPQLVAAVGEVGGMGFLAGGYQTPEQLAEQIFTTRELTERPFGVNLFVPAPTSEAEQGAGVAAYRQLLEEEAGRRGTVVPHPYWGDTDHWADKLALLTIEPVAVASFTFGCPSAQEVEQLHAVGTAVVITVTDADEARAAQDVGAGALCVQGFEAGAHRGTHAVTAEPNSLDHLGLLGLLSTVVDLPMVAAGGVTTAGDTRRARDAGAVAVQAGTAFLRTPEAGTNAVHRTALTDPAFTTSVVTRAFSGRPARALSNAFIDRYDGRAPAVFPVIDQLTKPLRAAAVEAGDPDGVSLWAGTGWRATTDQPAGEVVRQLSGS